MADVSPPFGTLLIPNKTGDSQIEYPIEKTSVLIGRYVLDRDWDDPPGNRFVVGKRQRRMLTLSHRS